MTKKGIPLGDLTIRMAKIAGCTYLNRDDVINLLRLTKERASSLNSQSDLEGVIETLSEGIEDYCEIEPEEKNGQRSET